MKGKISQKLEMILQNPKASRELRTFLLKGSGGKLAIDGKKFNVRVDVRKSIKGSIGHQPLTQKPKE